MSVSTSSPTARRRLVADRGRYPPPLLLLVLLALLMTACSGDLKRITLNGRIAASDDLNPNYEGGASPVVVRIYQLKTLGSFQSADFFSLLDNESSVLGEDLIAREEMELRPGETLDFKRDFSPRANYIGVLAAFRDLENARWRAFAALPRKSKVGVRIQLERLAVSVSVQP